MNNKLTLLLILLTLYVAAAGSVLGQKDLKPWKEWSKKDAEKVLNDSPWAHQQIDMDLLEPSPLTRPRDPSINARLKQGEGLTYGIRFFSARPVRQAFVRIMQLQRKDLSPDMSARLDKFAEAPAAGSIIIAVTIAGPEANELGKVMQSLMKATTPTLKNSTYLERNDGKRVFLEQYTPPGADGFGARFIFPRMVDDKPFLTTEFTGVRFVSELDSSIKFYMTFEVANMLLNGKLEY